MRGPVEDLEALLADSFEVEEIRTSEDVLEVRLRKGRLRVALTLGREEARDLLARPGLQSPSER